MDWIASPVYRIVRSYLELFKEVLTGVGYRAGSRATPRLAEVLLECPEVTRLDASSEFRVAYDEWQDLHADDNLQTYLTGLSWDQLVGLTLSESDCVLPRETSGDVRDGGASMIAPAILTLRGKGGGPKPSSSAGVSGWPIDCVVEHDRSGAGRRFTTGGVPSGPDYRPVPDPYSSLWRSSSDDGQLGPVYLEAFSPTERERSVRLLFWSGLLVGVASSCMLLLFEFLWDRPERAGGTRPGFTCKVKSRGPEPGEPSGEAEPPVGRHSAPAKTSDDRPTARDEDEECSGS